MKRTLFLSLAIVLVLGFAYAQDMDTKAFVDQFDSGGTNQRGGNDDQGPAGSYDGDWSFLVLTDGTAGLSGADVNYVNLFSGQYSQPPSEIESPVVDVTSSSNLNPDRTWAMPAIIGNTRPGATSPNYAVIVGDDGGHNELGFGEWDDSNYEVKVDVFLPDHTGTLNNANNEFVRFGMAVRIQKDPVDLTSEETPTEGAGFVTIPPGCYCLLYDSSEGKVYPIKIIAQDTAGWDDLRDKSFPNVGTTTVPVAEFLGSGVAVSEGWHTLGIKASGANLTFTVDSSTDEVTDSTYSSGKAALMYRTSSSGTSNLTYDHGAKFDNLRVDPAPPPPVLSVDSQWSLYE